MTVSISRTITDWSAYAGGRDLPLTTTFTPPPACSANVFTLGTASDEDQTGIVTIGFSDYEPGSLIRGVRTECYPSGFFVSTDVASYTSAGTVSSIINSYFRLFSPGICPENYRAQAQQYIDSETLQTCCPSGMYLDTMTRCGSTLGTQYTILSSTGEMTNHATITASAALPVAAEEVTTLYTTLTYPSLNMGMVFEFPIVVAWQSSDLNLISPPTSRPTAATSPGSSSNSTSPAVLSLGAKIGIGVAVPLLVAVLTAILWVVLWNRHKRLLAARAASRDSDDDVVTKPELPGAEQARWITEMDMDAGIHEFEGQKGPLEADGTPTRVELDTGWRGWEAPSPPRKVETRWE